MAGIGEATAIITVAQVGISLSQAIIGFVGEVRDAPKSIRRIGREISTTSERLEEIGHLIDRNATSHLFSKGGIASAVRCSSDCGEIITQVSGILGKAGWIPGSGALEKKDIDISLIDSFWWPFLRKKLIAPQADLEKLKASLSLLFNSAMANASSNPTQSPYAWELPRLQRQTEQATRRAEEARRANETGSKPRKTHQRGVHWDDEEDDAEIRQQFLDYQVKLAKEQEDERARERAAYLEAEGEKQRKAEENARIEIERKAIEDYKREQEESKAQALKREGKFEEELKVLGLEPEQIQSIIAVPSLKLPQSRSADGARPRPSSGRPSLKERNSTNTRNGLPTAAPTRASSKKRSTFPWLRPRLSQSRYTDSSSSPPSSTGDDQFHEDELHRRMFGVELWLVDAVSGQTTELAPSHDWLRSKLSKAKHHDIWQRLAQLKPQSRNTVLQFVDDRNQQQDPHSGWRLRFIGLPRRASKVPFFGHRHGECLVQLILCQRAGDSVAGASLKPSIKDLDSSQYQQQRQTLGASFADNTDTDQRIMNVTFEVDVINDNEDSPAGSTLIPKELVVADALKELEVPFMDLSQDPDFFEQPQELLRVPTLLADSKVEELIRLTRLKIVDGEAPWIKPPKWGLGRRERRYYKSIRPSHDRDGRGPQVGANAPTGLDTETEIEQLEKRLSELRGGREGTPVVLNARKPLMSDRRSREDEGSRRTAASGRTEEIIISRDDWNRPLGGYEPEEYIEQRRDDRDEIIIAPKRAERRIISERPGSAPPRTREREYPLDQDSPPRHTEDGESFRSVHSPPPRRDLSNYYEARPSSVESYEIVTRQGKSRKERSPSIAEIDRRQDERERKRSLEQIRNLEREREQWRRSRRRARESVRVEENDGWITMRRNERSRSPSPERPLNPQLLARNEPGPIALRERRPVRRQSSLDTFHRRPTFNRELQLGAYDESHKPRFTNRRSTIVPTTKHRRLPIKASSSYYPPTNGDRAPRPPRKHDFRYESASGDEDIISSTLKRFTTFNNDDSLAREQPAWMMSPHQIDSPESSDNDDGPAMTLDQAETRLRDLVAKQEKATKDGDLTIASHLQFYAIPDVRFQVEELKVREAKAKDAGGLEQKVEEHNSKEQGEALIVEEKAQELEEEQGRKTKEEASLTQRKTSDQENVDAIAGARDKDDQSGGRNSSRGSSTRKSDEDQGGVTGTHEVPHDPINTIVPDAGFENRFVNGDGLRRSIRRRATVEDQMD